MNPELIERLVTELRLDRDRLRPEVTPEEAGLDSLGIVELSVALTACGITITEVALARAEHPAGAGAAPRRGVGGGPASARPTTSGEPPTVPPGEIAAQLTRPAAAGRGPLPRTDEPGGPLHLPLSPVLPSHADALAPASWTKNSRPCTPDL